MEKHLNYLKTFKIQTDKSYIYVPAILKDEWSLRFQKSSFLLSAIKYRKWDGWESRTLLYLFKPTLK